jgi:hypothetical protein
MKVAVKYALIAVLSLTPAVALAEPKDDPWSAFRFLIGEWAGEGDGTPDKGSGGFTLAPDLGGKVLVRRNRAEYPAANGRPAAVHEDLMVITPAAAGKAAQATYWDNEGHVIRYTVSSEGGRLEFLSDVVADQPRFRLSYANVDKTTVALKFEIAPPGKPDSFKTYIEAKCRRKAPEAAGQKSGR